MVPRTSTAVNRRDVVYKYYPLSDEPGSKSMAVVGGRCRKCGKIVTTYCTECHKPYCEKHMEDNLCAKCKDHVRSGKGRKISSYIG